MPKPRLLGNAACCQWSGLLLRAHGIRELWAPGLRTCSCRRCHLRGCPCLLHGRLLRLKLAHQVWWQLSDLLLPMRKVAPVPKGTRPLLPPAGCMPCFGDTARQQAQQTCRAAAARQTIASSMAVSPLHC